MYDLAYFSYFYGFLWGSLLEVDTIHTADKMPNAQSFFLISVPDLSTPLIVLVS
jgi:hypothetical protein